MDINLHEIAVRDLVEGYRNDDEEGVVGYGGQLNIRPKYQREFIYKDEQRNAVIETILQGFPLNVMYWVKQAEGVYEVMDGQQRTISICDYIDGNFTIDIDGMPRSFNNLPANQKNKILDYKLTVYFCEGTEEEKLKWFRTVNIAGEKLTDQELRNAVYAGPFTIDAKKFFSKTQCTAYKLAKDYMSGTPIRQDYLQTALKWISKGHIEDYMSAHQQDPNANQLKTYFRAVIDWVRLTFPKYRKEMKGLDWGTLYDSYHDEIFDTNQLEARIQTLMMDDDVTNKKGIYFYVLTDDEKHLNIRAFTPAMKRAAYERQGGICAACKKQFELEDMEGDHITPWHEGGKTNAANCQMLCKSCNRRKSGK